MVSMPCIFSPLAASDLEEIGDYIAQDNPGRLHLFVKSGNVAKK
jgi:plasmid stabilization system protein ParE